MEVITTSLDIDNIHVHFISDNTVEGVVSLREFIEYGSEQVGKYAETLAREIAETVAMLIEHPEYTNIGRAVFSSTEDESEYVLLLDRHYNAGETVKVDELGGGIRH